MKIRYLFIVCLLFLCSGCSDNSDNKRVLNILNWSSYIPSDVIIDFERKTD